MRRARLTGIARGFGKTVVYVVVAALIVVGAGILVLETGWAKNRIRHLIVAQANQYLTATLEIGRLEGSILRGLQLGDIRLSRDNHPIITIDEVSLSYSLRELWQNGTVIRRIRLIRPSFAIAKQRDGRWNIGALVRREARQERSTGPGRPIQSALHRDRRRPRVARKPARIRRRARADRFRIVERVVFVRVPPGDLDADVRESVVCGARAGPQHVEDRGQPRQRTPRLAVRSLLGADPAERLHAGRRDPSATSIRHGST